MMIQNFHFIRPDVWWLILLLIPIIWLVLRYRGNAGKWQEVIDPNLLAYLLQGKATQPTWLYLSLFSIAWTLVVLALSGPSWHQLPQQVYQSTDPLMIVLDLSADMTAQDVKPSRLQQAKFKIYDLIKARHDGSTGLLVYASEPYLVSPLTQDANTLNGLVDVVAPELLPVSGKNTAAALNKALTILNNAKASRGNVLLITSGNIQSSALLVAKKLREEGFRLFVLGVGTKAGAPIHNRDGQFVHDQQGQVVLSNLHEDQLRALANSGDGQFFQSSVGDHDIQQLLPHLVMQHSVKQVSERLKWQDEGHWFILLALPFVLFAFRRGYF